uniref:BAR domain-containing protein n=1 Tax=Noccaea caerulescens TaxID=107243 RepID=A0A1J3ISR4_NOCCA
MKTSLRRLRGVLHKHDSTDRRDLRALVQKDELAQASQEVQDMRDCYDSLLSAAAATANTAYEFSESLRELGACLLEKTALNDDEESGRVLIMLGKLQFELQKLVDKYRSHIFQTITIPSESLLNELSIVEEMKRLCDEKRNVYEGMLTRQREKGWSKGGKGEFFSTQQLQEAHEEYDNETTLFVFRLKSLKQGQTRSLLTQAARHHAAQLCFFKKALNSLEEVEPHVQMVSESQHIDYHFSGLEDDDGDDEIENNEDDGSEVHDDGELSFEDRVNDKDQDADSSAAVSSELSQSDITLPLVARPDTAQEYAEVNYRKSLSYRRDVRIGSQSAPLFAENHTIPPSEKLLRMRSSLTRKFSTYALPTPGETTRSPSSTTSPGKNSVASSNPSKAITKQIWFSSPLEARGPANVSSKSVASLKEQVLRESNKNRLPPPLVDRPLYSRLGTLKRRSFSGPITSKPLPNKPLSATPHLYSGPIPRNSLSKLPKVSSSSPTASPTFVSTPKISELHELPRPPPSSSIKSSRAFEYSAPLVSKSELLRKAPISNSASPLPIPPAITRSFSIPTSNLRAAELDMSKTSLGSTSTDKLGTASPPLTPMSLIQTPPSALPDRADHLTMSKQERRS